uniref:Uncharacterized protein n=1 Tax=Fagus sylvatica TaxID=28930 RepID=A0A2N9J2Y5_FAGSY
MLPSVLIRLAYKCVKTCPILVFDKFDLQGDSVDVNKSLNTKFANSLRQHVYRLHTKYKKAKLTHGDEYVRNHPPENVTAENWIELMTRSGLTLTLRNENPDKNKHRVGSKSLAVRVHEGEEMLRLEEEHLVDPDAIPLTPEEVSVRVLKPRSGYRQIAEIKEAANSEIAELKEANKRHEEMTANILEFLRSQGFTTPFGSGGSSSSSYRGDGN